MTKVVKTLRIEQQIALKKRVESEKRLLEERASLDTIDNQLRVYEQVRHDRDQQSLRHRDTITKQKLQQQALELQIGQLSDAIIDSELIFREVISRLSADAVA